MSKTTTNVANATTIEIGQSCTIAITGFTYIKDWAIIKGTEETTNEKVSVIIGDKMSFGMQDMLMLKQSEGIRATYKKDKVVSGKTYKQFQLEEILF